MQTSIINVKREKNGTMQAFLLKYLNNWVVGIYCHKASYYIIMENSIYVINIQINITLFHLIYMCVCVCLNANWKNVNICNFPSLHELEGLNNVQSMHLVGVKHVFLRRFILFINWSEISLGDWLLFGASTMVLLFFFFVLYFFLTDAEGLGGFFCCCFSFSLFCISFLSRIPYLCLKITSLTQDKKMKTTYWLELLNIHGILLCLTNIVLPVHFDLLFVFILNA